MKILQVGSGSMGTRRLRDLHQRKDVTLALYDERPDRRLAAQARFGVKLFSRLDEAMAWGPEALVISTPPGTKGSYVNLAIEGGLHHFIEGDIWTYGAVPRVARLKHVVSAPSASFGFLPVVRALGPLVRDLGTLLSYQHTYATYMPDWHAHEGNEYYARHRNAAPAREMVCFELTLLDPLFGPAAEVAGNFDKYGSLPGKTEDTWTLLMRLKNGGVGQLASAMSCKRPYQGGCCFGSNGVVTWDIKAGDVTVQTGSDKEIRRAHYGAIGDVLEASYFEEINTFVDAAFGKASWPQSYALSQQSTATLAAAEKSSATGQWVKVDPAAEPDPSPPVRG